MNLPDSPPDGQSFLQHPRVIQIRRTLMAIWVALLFSMGWVSYVLFHALKAPILSSTVGTLAATFAGALSFILPNWISKKFKPGRGFDQLDAQLGMILINHILKFALTEMALIFALLSNPSLTAGGTAILYLLAAAMMIFHFPSEVRVQSIGFSGDKG